MQLDVKNLYYNYYKQPLIAKGINFSLQKNRNLLILGKLGAGKTTMLKVLSGFDDNYLGSIKFDGVELKGCDCFKLNFSLILTTPVFFENKTVGQNIDFLCDTISHEHFSEEELSEILREFNLQADSKTKVKKLTLIEKRKLSIVRSFIKKPNILFLDDMFESIDEKNYDEIVNLYKQIMEKFKSSMIVFCAAEKSFKLLKNIGLAKNIDVAYMNLGNFWMFGSCSQFENSFADRDFFDFVDNFSHIDGQIYKADGTYIVRISDKREFELDKKHNKNLDAMNFDKIEYDDVIIFYVGEFDYENITNEDFEKLISGKKIFVYSKLDSKKIL